MRIKEVGLSSIEYELTLLSFLLFKLFPLALVPVRIGEPNINRTKSSSKLMKNKGSI